MSEQFESMMEGITELLEYAKGDKRKGRTRVVENKTLKVSPLKQYNSEEIRQIRLCHHLTQKKFAECFGVSQKTVESWERGENSPSGASLRLFQLLERNVNILEECEIITTVKSLHSQDPVA